MTSYVIFGGGAWIPRYGNYGGPGWTGGQFGGIDFPVPSVNRLDEIFKRHDQAYGAATSPIMFAMANRQLQFDIIQLMQRREFFELHSRDQVYAVISYIYFPYQALAVYSQSQMADMGRFILSPLIRLIDPLTLDLDGDGIELTALGTAGQTGASTVFFDFDGDGFKERTGWVKADDGMLAIDLNGNGLIDNGGELFGQPARDGYEVLETYDTFADGVIDAKDAAFARLRIWRDLDQDGVTDAGELKTLTESGITSIALTRTDVTGTNQGNDRGFPGGFTRANGTTGTAETIYFATDRRDTRVDPTPNFLSARVTVALTGATP